MSMQNLWQSSYLANEDYLEYLYECYLTDPNSVDLTWQQYLAKYLDYWKQLNATKEGPSIYEGTKGHVEKNLNAIDIDSIKKTKHKHIHTINLGRKDKKK